MPAKILPPEIAHKSHITYIKQRGRAHRSLAGKSPAWLKAALEDAATNYPKVSPE